MYTGGIKDGLPGQRIESLLETSTVRFGRALVSLLSPACALSEDRDGNLWIGSFGSVR